MNRTVTLVLGICILFACDVLVWKRIIASERQPVGIHFLDVGQGDSTLLQLGNASVLNDAGPDGAVVQALQHVGQGRYIDIGIISHAQKDHFNGFNSVLDHFDIGAVLFNGRQPEPMTADWRTLEEKLDKKHIPMIPIMASDSIHYASNTIAILSPSPIWIQSAEPNDTGIVALVDSASLRTLLTADISAHIEEELTQQYNLKSTVLKVAHHGSRYSSSEAFLHAVNPAVAVIQAGAHNHYGHPHPESLERLQKETHAKVFRTDRSGTISVYPKEHTMIVRTEKYLSPQE